MLKQIYFCLFCPQKFDQKDEAVLRKHLISRHFEDKEDPIVDKWIDSMVTYQKELNLCLSSDPMSLPESSMCQSAQNNGKQKLLKGCGLCDRIIQCFKLDIDLVKKRKEYCICGGGLEVNKVVVTCHQCKHLYHYPCVEPTGYSGEETSLYKCLKCKQKDFEISDLSSESQLMQRIHISHHYNYQPFVCKVKAVGDRTLVCNESFYSQNFLRTHLKTDHKLMPKEKEISNYYEFDSIPKVQQLVDSSLRKLSQTNTSPQLVGQTSTQNTLLMTSEIDSSLQTNKRLRSETFQRRGEQTTRELSHNNDSSDTLPPPLLLEPSSINYRNSSISRPPQLAPAFGSSPPVLINQSDFNQTNRLNGSQMPKKGRGRPKGSKSKTKDNRSNARGGHSSGTNGRQIITPNTYMADGNPQLKSRLSVQSRLSRPNISLSREEERVLQNKRSKTNGNRKFLNNTNNGDDSDWDSDVEKYETIRRSDQQRVFESTISPNTSVESSSKNKRSPIGTVIGPQDIHQIVRECDSNKESHSAQNRLNPEQRNSLKDIPTLSPVTTPKKPIISSTTVRAFAGPVKARTPPESTFAPQTNQVSKEKVTRNQGSTESQMSNTNDEPITNVRPPLLTQVIRVENSESMDTRPENMISSPDNNLQNEEPAVKESHSHSDWLTHTKPKKFPYFPQINDEVVYIPYGHRLYIQTVRKLGLYLQTNPTKYVSDEYMNEILFAKIKDIKFEKHSNVRLTRLTLALYENNIETNRTFIVRFHDIDNVLDFIILRQTYDNSLLRNWKIGDLFRAIIDDQWWFGEIKSYNMEDYNLSTQFQVLNIIWANGTTDILSFWDLEPILGEVPQNRNISIDVTDEDRKLFFISEVQEWPVYGKEQECKRVFNGLSQVMELKEYKELMEVMNPSNKEYMDKVPYLINLSIVRSRVQNMFYRRHAAIKSDIKFLESTAKIIDKEGRNGVLTNAQIIVAVCLKFIDEHRSETIEHIYTRVKEDPAILSKIKFYACTRPHMNTTPNVLNPLIASTYAQIFNSGCDTALNILTPSTTRPIVNRIRRSNESDVSVIDLSSDDDNEEEQGSQPRVQEVINQLDDNMVSHRAPESHTPQPSESIELPSISQTKSQTPRPVVTVRAQPIEERSLNRAQQTPIVFKRYFCIFCTETFVERNEAMDHFCDELKVKLKCSQCPQDLRFESFDDFMDHNSEHIRQIKPSINSKTYSNTKAWIEKLLVYMDSLSNRAAVQSQIHPKFGDCCLVCKGLNTLTHDSQPLFHKDVFANNRYSMKSTVNAEVEFAQHLRRHLKYEPIYYCTICTINNPNNAFTSVSIDEKCGEHLQTTHNIALPSAQASELTSFFGNTKITIIDDMIPNSVNLFIINCSNW